MLGKQVSVVLTMREEEGVEMGVVHGGGLMTDDFLRAWELN